MHPVPAHAPGAAEMLTARQRAIASLSAFAAAGDMVRLDTALSQGLDAGMTVSDAREILVQLYAYAGFPRRLNALGVLMKVLDARRQRGIRDAPGSAPSRPIPKGDALLAAGTANQIRLSGGPVEGPLFDFAPMANEYLRTHLFGDIFERDNLDWPSRELATLGMLSALPGAEAQLQAHMRIGMNAGLTAGQLRQLRRCWVRRWTPRWAAAPARRWSGTWRSRRGREQGVPPGRVRDGAANGRRSGIRAASEPQSMTKRQRSRSDRGAAAAFVS